MHITEEEKLMYRVMNAICDSGIPISFKGSMVLKACLLEAGYNNDIRHTVDIDANWNSDVPPTLTQMVNSLQKAINNEGINLEVREFRMYGEGRSAGFELIDKDTKETLFTMDIDVNRPIPSTKIYEISNVKFCGASPIQMISDKIAVVSSDKIFRRIKDVVDLYYLSHVFELGCENILNTLKKSGKSLSNFNGFLNRVDELKHSYNKFRFAGDITKPSFEEVYQKVKTFIKDLLPQSINNGSGK